MKQQSPIERSRGFAAAAGCALLLAGLVALAHPLAEMGMNDDWSYAFSAKRLFETGHIFYNGWATAVIGFQLWWASLFIRVLGFSFLSLRLSVLFLSMITLVVVHRLFHRCGLSERHCSVGTLTVMLSPIFFLLSFSFMTDIPGLLGIICCSYGAVRAVQAESDRQAVTWLWIAVAADFILGSPRQIAWVGLIVLVPSAIWLLRGRRAVLLAGIGAWLAGLASVLAALHWFSQQPYVLHEPLLIRPVEGVGHRLLSTQVRNLLGLVLYQAPVCLLLVSKAPWRNRYFRLLTLVAGILCLAGTLRLRHSWAGKPFFPFTSNTLGVGGFIDANTIGGIRPVLLGHTWQSTATFVTAMLLVCMFLVWRFAPREESAKGRRETGLPHPQLLILFGPFALAYYALAATRDYMWDRYGLAMSVLAVLVVLRFYQDRLGGRAPALIVLPLLLFAAFNTAALHDVFALYRARLSAGDMLQAKGIPKTRFTNGFEYDAWTELEATGYIKERRLHPPAGLPAYNEEVPASHPCLTWFAHRTPSVQPRYGVNFTLPACEKAAPFPAVPYRTWLPPQEHSLVIGEFRR